MLRYTPANMHHQKRDQTAAKKVSQIREVLDAVFNVDVEAPPIEGEETDTQIETRIRERFEILQDLTDGALSGEVRSLIVSGPPGLGKSYTIEEALRAWDSEGNNHCVIKGYVRATGLYKLLYQYRRPGQVLVFDDADSILRDEVGLNLLKSVCDSDNQRRVSYMTEGTMHDNDTNEKLPKQFDFQGTVIFITNLDFDVMIAKGNKLAPHLQAMMSFHRTATADYFATVRGLQIATLFFPVP